MKLFSKLQRHNLENVQNLVSDLEKTQKTCLNLNVSHYTGQIDSCWSEFEKCSQDFVVFELVATFSDIGIELLASKNSNTFSYNLS